MENNFEKDYINILETIFSEEIILIKFDSLLTDEDIDNFFENI